MPVYYVLSVFYNSDNFTVMSPSIALLVWNWKMKLFDRQVWFQKWALASALRTLFIHRDKAGGCPTALASYLRLLNRDAIVVRLFGNSPRSRLSSSVLPVNSAIQALACPQCFLSLLSGRFHYPVSNSFPMVCCLAVGLALAFRR